MRKPALCICEGAFVFSIQIISILHECEVLIEKSVPWVIVWHQEAPPSDANCDPRDRFVDRYLKLMTDSFSCTPMGANT